MPRKTPDVTIRKIEKLDVKKVYKLLVANRPFVGLNSRYTYFLLARDFYDTCIVAEHKGEIIAFSSGYVPPNRKDTLFNWETVIQKNHRGKGLQKILLLYQLALANVNYLEGTVNPSNQASKRGFHRLAKLLETNCEESTFLTEADFDNDGHEAEILYRIGPFSPLKVKELLTYSRATL